MPDYRKQACPRSIAKESQLRQKKKSIFDAAEKIGKLEFLNDFGKGGGAIRQTLETLAISSNAIRTGSTVPDDVGGGNVGGTTSGRFADSILEKMELGGAVQATVAQFDPGAVNGAVGAAKVLAKDVQDGRFKLEDIPNRIQDFQNLEGIVGKIFREPTTGVDGKDYQKFKCRPSPYAADLVGRAPKQNFQFVIDIKIQPEYMKQFGLSGEELQQRSSIPERSESARASLALPTASLGPHLAFLVKASDRPSISYDYEELNYYNHRTKIARRAMFNPVNMRFYDDQLNSAASFYSFYTRAMTPVTNLIGQDNNRGLEERGMDFFSETKRSVSINSEKQTANEREFFGEGYSATIGSLIAKEGGDLTTKTVLSEITLYQFGKSATSVTAFTMYNPKITSFTPSATDMTTSGDGQELAFEFEYDYFTIEPEIPINLFTNGHFARLTGEDVGATYPIDWFETQDPSASREQFSAKGAIVGALADVRDNVADFFTGGDTPVGSEGTPIQSGGAYTTPAPIPEQAIPINDDN